MRSNRILMIEDDEIIIYGLAELLREEGFEVTPVCSLKEALQMDGKDFCLVLLDLGLPDGEGWQFLERAGMKRLAGESKRKTMPLAMSLAMPAAMPPVIILTAREEEADVVKGLDMGADDYVIKPFKTGILLSRIRAVLRRQERFEGKGECLTCGKLVLDRKRTLVTAGGERLDLTAGEFRLLEYFMANKNRTLTRNALMERLWDNEGDYINDNTLTVTIKRLREKLGEESRSLLKTVRGIGYQMEDCSD